MEKHVMMHMLNFDCKFISSLDYAEALEYKIHEYKMSKKRALKYAGKNVRPMTGFRSYVKKNLRLISSFSFYHWMVIEMLERDEIVIKDINKEILNELVDIVLPNGETIYHRLVKKNISQFEALMSII